MLSKSDTNLSLNWAAKKAKENEIFFVFEVFDYHLLIAFNVNVFQSSACEAIWHSYKDFPVS